MPSAAKHVKKLLDQNIRDGQIFLGGEGKGKGKRIFRAPALLFVSDSSVVRSSV
jgi:hypothetical protein